ncbi:MAG: hypothetical protein AAFO96_07910 [Bacteroidota bacterium]
MNRKLYHILITVVFGIISIPLAIDLLFPENQIPDTTRIPFLGMAILFLILYSETRQIRNRLGWIIGTLSVSALIIGFLFKVLHWPLAHVIMMGSGTLWIINFLVFAFIEKNKSLLNYLLLVYVGMRLLSAVGSFSALGDASQEIIWWLSFGLTAAIPLTGIVYLILGKNPEEG